MPTSFKSTCRLQNSVTHPKVYYSMGLQYTLDSDPVAQPHLSCLTAHIQDLEQQVQALRQEVAARKKSAEDLETARALMRSERAQLEREWQEFRDKKKEVLEIINRLIQSMDD
ncbi:hypothetical protein BJ508DRAFT_324715 [Ascobolus immersus RN42]|uniref:Uncharacterized protein n=1 Tax=Ascobolus immersus RN42 TaxID=1160509 RepID=A0A3N4INH5_ASCIM|nr:hypothetical protein BJ508DRAFT_324715 [Ascobolus immersus RN42]